MSEAAIEQAAAWLREADALVVSAGAGMGVDSGLPDFRGEKGFWRAYPPYEKLGLRFEQLANPRWFRDDPALAWGFYGHRLGLYRRTVPHRGFSLLLGWARQKKLGHFVFTTNVDGAFQRAGFDGANVVEHHGAIDWLQCLDGCGVGIISADGYTVDVDEQTFRARGALPSCPRCGGLLRPNVLMFGDMGWDEARTFAQHERHDAWFDDLLRARPSRLLVIECGAGLAIPTARHFSERLGRLPFARVVRVNVRESQIDAPHVGVALGAREALERIATAGRQG